jgi:hypothetical protein
MDDAEHRNLWAALSLESHGSSPFSTNGPINLPAVRKIFEARFGEKRIRGGNEFTSVQSTLNNIDVAIDNLKQGGHEDLGSALSRMTEAIAKSGLAEPRKKELLEEQEVEPPGRQFSPANR